GGQRGLAQALGPDGNPLPQQGGRQGAAGNAAPQANPQAPAPAAQQPAAQEAQQQPAAQPGRGRGRGGRGGQAQGQAQGQGQANAADDADDNEVVFAGLVGTGGGGLTPLIFAAREGDLESAKALLDAGANINHQSEYGWTPLLTAVNNRNYQLASYLLQKG